MLKKFPWWVKRERLIHIPSMKTISKAIFRTFLRTTDYGPSAQNTAEKNSTPHSTVIDHQRIRFRSTAQKDKWNRIGVQGRRRMRVRTGGQYSLHFINMVSYRVSRRDEHVADWITASYCRCMDTIPKKRALRCRTPSAAKRCYRWCKIGYDWSHFHSQWHVS